MTRVCAAASGHPLIFRSPFSPPFHPASGRVGTACQPSCLSRAPSAGRGAIYLALLIITRAPLPKQKGNAGRRTGTASNGDPHSLSEKMVNYLPSIKALTMIEIS